MDENSFTNEQIEVNQLPQFQDIDFTPLEKGHLKANLLVIAIIGAIPVSILSIISIFKEEARMVLLLVALGVFLLFCLFGFLSYLGFKHKGYALREKDIAFKSGLIFRHQVALPFNRVQHCEINEGPIDRYHGLADLKIFTAGGSSSDLEIPGLLRERAEQLKQIIVQKTGVDEEE